MTPNGFAPGFGECLAGPAIPDAYFDGLIIRADPITTGRYDQVLPILPEEQVFTSRMLRRLLAKVYNSKNKPLKVLDVGTGSGVFAIEAARAGHLVTAIDISNRAVRFAALNATKNGISILPTSSADVPGAIKLIQGDAESFFETGFDVVILNPPFNPTPTGFRTSLHSQEGGLLGQDVFDWQLKKARDCWLNESGVCAGVHMILHEDANPATAFSESAATHVHSIIKDPIDACEFIGRQYSELITTDNNEVKQAVSDYLLKVKQEGSTKCFSLIYFEQYQCAIEASRQCIDSVPQLDKASWKRRIDLHKLISYSGPRLRESPFIEIDLNCLPSSGCRLALDGMEALLSSWCKYASSENERPILVLTDVSPRHDVLTSMGRIQQEVGIVSPTDVQSDQISEKYTDIVRKLQSSSLGSYLHPFFIKNDSLRSKRVAYLSVNGDFHIHLADESNVESNNSAAIKIYKTPLQSLKVKELSEMESAVSGRNSKSPCGDFEMVHNKLHQELDELESVATKAQSIVSFLLSCPLRPLNSTGNRGGEIDSYQGGAWLYCRFASAWSPHKEALLADLARTLATWSLAKISSEANKVVLESLQKSARAAVFARNFSHITGSHVVSSPEFRHSLVGENVMRAMRGQFDRVCRDFIMAENDLFRYAVEEGRDTEQLWREGAKVLDNARHHLRTGGGLLENTRRFHEYLQGRFDFIARAIDDTKDQPEPLFFVEDLVEGFLSQTAFLDALVADVGLRREQMHFKVSLPNASEPVNRVCFLAKWELNRDTDALDIAWDPADGPTTGQDIRKHAVMVALPGGMVSAHALYSLLENIIRNSAKYGSLKERRLEDKSHYELTLWLERKEGHFELRIWDNFSGACREKDGRSDPVWDKLQTKLEKDFVNENGIAERDDLGMLEMQACAGMLCRERNGAFPGDRPREVCRKNGDGLNLWVENPGGPSFVAPIDTNDKKLLAYHLSLNAPVLMGVVCKADDQTANKNRRLSRVCSEITEMREHWPHLLVMDGKREDDEKLKGWLKEIAENHQAYPYRLLVLCESEGDALSCKEEWAKQTEGKIVSPRRVGILGCNDLHAKVFAPLPKDAKEAQEQERMSILASYEAWLRAWKGQPADKKDGKWHLWIGLEREEKQIEEAWVERIRGFDSALIQLGVRAYRESQQNGKLWLANGVKAEDAFHPDDRGLSLMDDAERSGKSTESLYWDVERSARPTQKSALVFDNHGNCFPDAKKVEDEKDFRRATRFYQKLTGSLTPDLFRMLSRPPRDEFTFSFFIHSLVEACLTNVMVVDERVAWNLIEGGEGGLNASLRFPEDLAAHQKAGVFPIFRFRQKEAGEKYGFYNGKHRELTTEAVGNLDCLNEEGVRFPSSGSGQTPAELKILASKADKQFEPVPSNDKSFPCDVLLIHEGAMDILTSEQGFEWNRENDKDKLYAIAPAVVRTSGRGRKSNKLGEELPFIEFGEVSSALLTARNKYSLVRGLLGSAGAEKSKKQT